MKHKLVVKPKYLKFLGFLYNSAQVIYPYILIPESLNTKLKESDPDSIGILEHEKVHLKRMKDLGICKWYLEYIFNRKFRLDEEVIAYKKQSKVLKKYNIDFDIDKYSKTLSSWLYLKMVNKDKAKELLISQTNYPLLKQAIKESWSKDTTYEEIRDKWTKENKSYGQCAVTALLIQNYLGGEIYKADVKGEKYSHFWNVLPNGEVVDLTKKQFGNKEIKFINVEIKDRGELMKNKDLKNRYEILRSRVEKYISKI